MSVSAFAERLRNAMNSRELKQVDLVHAAERRGVKMGKSHISQYVAGKTTERNSHVGGNGNSCCSPPYLWQITQA